MTGLTRTADHRYQWNGGPFVPGATSVLRVLEKPALVQWAKNETAACAIRNYDFVTELRRRGGDPAAIKWLAAIPDFQRDTAADLGSAVHTLAEQIVRGGDVTVPEEQVPIVDGYRRWLDDAKPDKIRVERMVYSEQGYGGTLDVICQLDGQTWLLDIKTGKGVYDETRLQLAAYGHADWIGQPDDGRKYRVPKIDRYGVLHLRPDKYATGYALVEFAVNDDDFQAFLACLRLTSWRAALNGKGTP
jgi:hypothetical protein